MITEKSSIFANGITAAVTPFAGIISYQDSENFFSPKIKIESDCIGLLLLFFVSPVLTFFFFFFPRKAHKNVRLIGKIHNMTFT
jgi:hypothetical protein